MLRELVNPGASYSQHRSSSLYVHLALENQRPLQEGDLCQVENLDLHNINL